MRRAERESLTKTHSTFKALKQFQKELESIGIKVPGADRHASKRLVDQKPLSWSLKHNDLQLLKLIRLAHQDQEEQKATLDDSASISAGKNGRQANASLRDVVDDMAQEARDCLEGLIEEQERSRDWGEKATEEYDFLISQSKDYMILKGCQPYVPGEGTCKPRERYGEAERSEEAMDDAVVDYARSAGLLDRFRKSTVDHPVASGAFMRPSAPSNDLLAVRVSHELELVRNRMFRLDSMLKEGRSNQLQVGRMSAIMSWKRDKEDAHNNLLHPVECIQSAEEMMDARLRSMSPRSPNCSLSSLRGNSLRSTATPGSGYSPEGLSPILRQQGRYLDDGQEGNTNSPSVRFDAVRPKTAGSPSRISFQGRDRPQTASNSLSKRLSDGPKTARL